MHTDMAKSANGTDVGVGGHPEHHHDESRVHEIIILVSVLTILAIIFVTLRFYIRYFKHKGGLWWDDWLILFSLGLSVGMAITQLVQLKYGFGQHIYDLPPGTDFKSSIKIFYYHQIMYLAVCGTVKLSILVFCLRLSRSLRLMVYFGIAFVTCSTIAVCLVDVFQCTPINFDWDPKAGGHCISRTPFYFSCAAINIVSDIYVYVLPMRTLWNIQLPKKQRIGILLVFAVGFFVVLTGFLRLHSLWKVSVTEDPTYDNAIVTLWSHTEFNIAIICACLPSLKILLKKVLGIVKNVRYTGGEQNSGGYSNSGTGISAARSPRSPMFPQSASTGYDADDDSLIRDRDIEKQSQRHINSRETNSDWEDTKGRKCSNHTQVVGCCGEEQAVEMEMMNGQSVIVKTTNVEVQVEERSPTSTCPPDTPTLPVQPLSLPSSTKRASSPSIGVAIAVPMSPIYTISSEGKADEVLGISRPGSMIR